MRRGPLGAIVAGLALLMQLLGPALASQGSATGTNSHMALCIQGSASEKPDGSNSGHTPPHHEHCGLCQIVCGAAGLVAIQLAWISLSQPADSRVAPWSLELERKARFGLDQYKVPRGPPNLA